MCKRFKTFLRLRLHQSTLTSSGSQPAYSLAAGRALQGCARTAGRLLHRCGVGAHAAPRGAAAMPFSPAKPAHAAYLACGEEEGGPGWGEQLLPFSCSSGKESRRQRFTALCLWKARGDGDEEGESRGGGSGVTEARTHAGGRTQVREPVAERSRAEVTMTMMLPHRRLRLRLPRPLSGPGDAMRSPQGQEGSAGCHGSALPRCKVPLGLPHKRCCPNRTRGAGTGRAAPPRSGRFHGPVLPLCVSISRMEIAMAQLCPEPQLARGHTYGGSPPFCSSSATAAQNQPSQSCTSPPRPVLSSFACLGNGTPTPQHSVGLTPVNAQSLNRADPTVIHQVGAPHPRGRDTA